MTSLAKIAIYIAILIYKEIASLKKAIKVAII